MAKKKTAQARIDVDLRTDFDWALTETGLGETQFIEACIKALVEQVKAEGGIWLPLAIVPKRKGKRPADLIQENSGKTDVTGAPGANLSTSSRLTPPTTPAAPERGSLKAVSKPKAPQK
jgi:hypothetical protein